MTWTWRAAPGAKAQARRRRYSEGWSDPGSPNRFKAPTALAVGAFLACTISHALLAHDRITTRVTWDREIAPIFEARCLECHRAGGKSTIPLATYPQARPWAVAIKEEVLARRMPKWSAARGYGDFANDPSLAPFEIALIAAWVDGGAPENEKNKALVAPATTVTPHVFVPPLRSSTRTTTRTCTEQRISGRLLAIHPSLDRHGSVGVAARLPSGREEVIAWIRDFDPDSETTYWLRNPLVLPGGSVLRTESSGACKIELTFAR